MTKKFCPYSLCENVLEMPSNSAELLKPILALSVETQKMGAVLSPEPQNLLFCLLWSLRSLALLFLLSQRDPFSSLNESRPACFMFHLCRACFCICVYIEHFFSDCQCRGYPWGVILCILYCVNVFN